jgi:hypothetical protein
MYISYKKIPDNDRYESLLLLNSREQWKESLYFTYYTPYNQDDERLFAGRHMSDVHNKQKECVCVLAFDFHRWDEKTIDDALALELPPVAFGERLKELFEKALKQRDSQPDGFTLKVK